MSRKRNKNKNKNKKKGTSMITKFFPAKETTTTTKFTKFELFEAQPDPVLKFTEECWDKLVYLNDQSDSELGAFGVCNADDALLVEEVIIVKQSVSMASVKFDDAAIAAFYGDQIAAGRQPYQFGRVWIHTHPGKGIPGPSQTDEETFTRVFGKADWAVMFITTGSKTGSFCRLRYNSSLKCDIEIPTKVLHPIRELVPQDAWDVEYDTNVTEVVLPYTIPHVTGKGTGHDWQKAYPSLYSNTAPAMTANTNIDRNDPEFRRFMAFEQVDPDKLDFGSLGFWWDEYKRVRRPIQ